MLGASRFPRVGSGVEAPRFSAPSAPPACALASEVSAPADGVQLTSALRLQLKNGCTVTLPAEGVFSIGRGERAQVRLEGDLVSRSHCRGELRDGRLWLSDESANGTYVNGKPLVHKQWTAVAADAQIGFGQSAHTARLQSGGAGESANDLVNRQGHRFHWPDEQDVIKVGRSEDSVLQLGNGQVSNSHALLRRREGQLMVLDTRSTNGTFVGGQRIESLRWTEVPAESELAFGGVETAWRTA